MPGLVNDEYLFKTITVEKLHPTFAAEVSGVNFDDLSEEQFSEILAAMAKVRMGRTQLTPFPRPINYIYLPTYEQKHFIENPLRRLRLPQHRSLRRSARILLAALRRSRQHQAVPHARRKPRYEHYELFDAGNVSVEENGDAAVAIFEDGENLVHDEKGDGSRGGKRGDEDVERFMGGELSPSKRPDMDCVAGLLSLSQGNWR
ncbi:hypothetical protein NUW58_g5369 [Xylaria curta]|uniref:Uncharacterized protein n=1 Tax=Xylaria curta TaxID=42375 RepID=A0ACC1P2E2_9PEZI|nr:hypothetical protein NUW58_g5369 [Xylaria curta]